MEDQTIELTILGDPIGKPRMTRQDKWQRRPRVVRYRNWSDRARMALYAAVKKHSLPPGLYRVSWNAYIGMADSWSAKKRDRLRGRLHFGKPDRDNIDKGLLDALFGDDRGVCSSRFMEKFWDDGQGPRLEVTITLLEGEMP